MRTNRWMLLIPNYIMAEEPVQELPLGGQTGSPGPLVAPPPNPHLCRLTSSGTSRYPDRGWQKEPKRSWNTVKDKHLQWTSYLILNTGIIWIMCNLKYYYKLLQDVNMCLNDQRGCSNVWMDSLTVSWWLEGSQPSPSPAAAARNHDANLPHPRS